MGDSDWLILLMGDFGSVNHLMGDSDWLNHPMDDSDWISNIVGDSDWLNHLILAEPSKMRIVCILCMNDLLKKEQIYNSCIHLSSG